MVLIFLYLDFYMLILKAASLAPTGGDYIVELLTILISNEQLWKFRYSWGNCKLIIGSKYDLKFGYGICKKNHNN